MSTVSADARDRVLCAARLGATEGAPAAGTAELIVAKQRHGSTGKVRMKFEAKITKFSDLADDSYDQGYE